MIYLLLIIILMILYWIFNFISDRSLQKTVYILLGLLIIILMLFMNIIGILLLSIMGGGVLIKIIKLRKY